MMDQKSHSIWQFVKAAFCKVEFINLAFCKLICTSSETVDNHTTSRYICKRDEKPLPFTRIGIQTLKHNSNIDANTLGLNMQTQRINVEQDTGFKLLVLIIDTIDPSQFCPSAWRENITNGVRVYGQPSTSDDTCHGTFYSSGGTKVIGYQVNWPP